MRQEPFDDPELSVGNAAVTHQAGWFVGPFLLADAGIRRTDQVEIKWGVHRAGERREKISSGGRFSSAAVLVAGSFVMEFPSRHRDVLLCQPGDYVLYGPSVAHSWHALTDATVLTVRWVADESSRP